MDEEEGTAVGHPFVVQWADGSVTSMTEEDVSRMYDLADCGHMDEIRTVLAANEKGALVPVTCGPLQHDPDYPECGGIVYATAVLMAGARQAGIVHFTDH